MRHRRLHRARGAVMIAALVCLTIVVALLGHLLVGTLRMQRQLQRERELRQCELLLQAGLERGQAKLVANRDYRGETWSVVLSDRSNASHGEVVIEIVDKTAEHPAELRATAEFPLGTPLSVRRSQALAIPLSSQNQE